MEKYKIGEVSRLLGISIDTLRYYETRGIVTPQKDSETNYRYYDAWDLNFLLDSKWHRSFGIPLADVEKMINEDGLEDFYDRYIHREEELIHTINAYQMKLRALVQQRQRVAKVGEEMGKFRMENSPELVYMRHRNNYEYDLSSNALPLFEKWINLFPFVNHTFEVPEKCIKDKESAEGYCWGFSLSPDEAIRFGLSIRPPLEYIPAEKSIYTVFSAGGRSTFFKSLREKVIEPVESKKHKINGSIHGHLIARTHEKGNFTRYFEVWVPID